MIKLCSKTGFQCLGKQLYRHCDMGIASIKNGVIPVPRHWDPEDLTLNKWLYNKNWIPVSSTGMTPSSYSNYLFICRLQCSYTEMLQRWGDISRT
nr:WPE palindromic element domain-containing protein [Wolbachia endosymbiont (group B) of Dolichovespula media]